jgi:hypothetical protein
MRTPSSERATSLAGTGAVAATARGSIAQEQKQVITINGRKNFNIGWQKLGTKSFDWKRQEMSRRLAREPEKSHHPNFTEAG